MRQKILITLLVIISGIAQTFAQQKTVTGKVTDPQGSGVAGVTVSVKGGKQATQTSADGTYSLSVPANGTLVFSSIGFVTAERNTAGQSTVDISLLTQNTNLNAVVVTGYGTARKRDVTGAITSITAKDFNQGVIATPEQLLQNKVAGLEITNNTGAPGGATTVKIRGNSSIRASQNPLYVIDGVPLDGGTARPDFSGAFGSTAGSNPLLFINPNDIAQVDVLKDASSAAIYGSRGANGVIAITTKKGSAGPLRVDVGMNYSVPIGFMKKFAVLDAGQFRSALTKYGLPTTLDGGSSVDAVKEVTQHKLSQNYNLGFSQGSDNGRFRASLLASSDNGFLRKSSLDKYIGTFSGTYKFIDQRLTFDFSLIAANYVETVTSVSNQVGSTGNLMSSALSWNPTVPFRDKNGLYILNSNGTANPLAVSDAYSDVSKVSEFLGHISGAYKLLSNLEYKFLYGINHGVGDRKINIEGFLTGFPGLSGEGNAAILNRDLTSQTFTHTLNYTSDISKDLKLDALAGFEYWKTISSGGGITARGFNTNLDQAKRINIPYTNIFQDAKTQNTYGTGVSPTTEIQSYFGRVNLNYYDKYLLTATFRADGSSKFGANKKYGYFPSVGAKWLINKESFMVNSTTFTNLALRGSYGVTGNQEFPSGAAQEQFNFGSYNNISQSIVANPNLKWEETHSYNVGLDFAFAKGKVYVSLDYYHKDTKNILFQTNSIQPAPNAIYFINLPADLINSGFELALGATIIDKPNFGWDVNFNVAKNKNIIKNFNDINTGLPLKIITGTIDGQGVSGTLSQIITNNQPVNEYYLKSFNGFDAGGNQIIGNDPAFAGDPNPHVIGGLSTSLRYDKWTFSVNTGGAFGFLIYNNTATSVTNINGITSGRNIDAKAFNSTEGKSSGVGASSRFLEKGDYVKLRNATIRYTAGSIGKYIKNLSVFVSGSNLFVITKFSGFDPEVNIDKTNGAYPSRSIEYIPYPTPRSISFGLNFSL
jgi:TonB-linked SusC/RagA family outer membrane protein